MTARFLLATFNAIDLLALLAWLGVLAYRLARVWPALDAGSAGPSARLELAQTSVLGALAGAIALSAGVLGPLTTPELRRPWVGMRAVLVIVGILAMFASASPASASGPGSAAQPTRPRRGGVIRDGIIFALGVGLLVAWAVRPTPRTSGILEPTPAERNREAARRQSADAEASESVEGGRRLDGRHKLGEFRDPGPATQSASGLPAGRP